MEIGLIPISTILSGKHFDKKGESFMSDEINKDYMGLIVESADLTAEMSEYEIASSYEEVTP